MDPTERFNGSMGRLVYKTPHYNIVDIYGKVVGKYIMVNIPVPCHHPMGSWSWNMNFKKISHCMVSLGTSGISLTISYLLKSCIIWICSLYKLVGGWTNPFEKYARQIGSFPQFSGWRKKTIWNHHLASHDLDSMGFVRIVSVESRRAKMEAAKKPSTVPWFKISRLVAHGNGWCMTKYDSKLKDIADLGIANDYLLHTNMFMHLHVFSDCIIKHWMWLKEPRLTIRSRKRTVVSAQNVCETCILVEMISSLEVILRNLDPHNGLN